MLFKCRNVGSKILNVINILNNHPAPLVKLNGSLKSTGVTNFFPRNFCSSNQDDNNEQLPYDLITNGDKELEHKLKVLELEMEVMKQDGLMVPEKSFVSVIQWKEILNMHTRSARIRFYEYLFKLMKTKENNQAKKLEKRKQYQEHLAQKVPIPDDLPVEEFSKIYNLGYNNILLRIYDSTMNQLYNNKLIQAIMFGEKLVIDCGYDAHMTNRENLNCAKQLMLLFAENRLHDDPFDLYMCNFNKQEKMANALHRYIPIMYEPWFPLNIHEGSYLDVFPKEKLVYLTPHCQEELQKFDYDDVYIIGGIVDKSSQEPLSLAKAKKEGLRMSKLPLDKYLNWGSGSGKCLPLNIIISILLELKSTQNWDIALKHVPRRKLVTHMTENLTAATDSLAYDRPPNRSKWVPSGIDFGNIRYGNKSSMDRKEIKRERLINLRNIINE